MVIGFIVIGFLWIVAFGFVLNRLIKRKAQSGGSEWSRKQMLWQNLNHTRRQQLLSYWTLSLGVFTVFAVGLNRPDFNDADSFERATGGYKVYVDSRVPIQYDLNIDEVRHKLSLDDLPAGTEFLQFLRHTEDEASCLNLNKVTQPTVLGIDLDMMSSFGLTPVTPSSQERINPSALPQVYVDEEALIWSLMMSVGDTLIYNNDKGIATSVLIAGTYPTGIFHGNAIMSTADFRRLWQQESGAGVLLVKTSQPELATEILSTAMSEYGLNIQTTTERLQMFFEVTDTYLRIFLTLGALGLLLGIFSMLVIVRKNLAADRAYICQLIALGFSFETLRSMLHLQNAIVPMYAVITGATGSLISIGANMTGAGMHTICIAIVSIVALCLSVYYGIKTIVNNHTI